jgi:hypothetical protein
MENRLEVEYFSINSPVYGCYTGGLFLIPGNLCHFFAGGLFNPTHLTAGCFYACPDGCSIRSHAFAFTFTHAHHYHSTSATVTGSRAARTGFRTAAAYSAYLHSNG